MLFKSSWVLGIALEFGVVRGQWPGFDGVSAVPCASSCFASFSSAYNWTSICSTATSTSATAPAAWSSLPSCLSTACSQTSYSFPTSYYQWNGGYPTSVCSDWLATGSGKPWPSKTRSGVSRTPESTVTYTTTTAATTGTGAGSTNDTAEILVTSTIMGTVVAAAATSNAASGPSPPFLGSRARNLDSWGAFIGFLVGMEAFL